MAEKKEISELQKILVLEETVKKGTLQDLREVLNTYKSFQITARALGLAARYRGIEFVDELLNHGASFMYSYVYGDPVQKKLKINFETATGYYHSEFYLLLISEKIKIDRYSPVCGFDNFEIAEDDSVLSLKDRIEITHSLINDKRAGVSADEMLFWALMWGEFEFSDALMEMGADFHTAPSYYHLAWNEESKTYSYMDIITMAPQSIYWNKYVEKISKLDSRDVMSIFLRLDKLARASGKKLIITAALFEKIQWDDSLLVFVMKNADFSKVDPKKALLMAVSHNAVEALALMEDMGWLVDRKCRDSMIEYANTNGFRDSLAWLMDYKNRTADLIAEELKDEAKMMKELTENPESVSALKKKWSYVKLEDGTLQITSYKGLDTEIEIPSVIGKDKVSSIGEEAFSKWQERIKNLEVRLTIQRVVIPEGVVEINNRAFDGCIKLKECKLPNSIKRIGICAFQNCESLQFITVPSKVTEISNQVFDGCAQLKECILPEGLQKIASFAFNNCKSLQTITIPKTVSEIGSDAFARCHKLKDCNLPESIQKLGSSLFWECRALTSITLPTNISEIKKELFKGCTNLTEVNLPKGLQKIGEAAFENCKSLQALYIPETVNAIEESSSFPMPFKGCKELTLHVSANSYAESYAKKKKLKYVTE